MYLKGLGFDLWLRAGFLPEGSERGRAYLIVIKPVAWVAIACNGVAEINSLDKLRLRGESTEKSNVFR
jgi:hypothetical protein